MLRAIFYASIIIQSTIEPHENVQAI
jgi:hypothetical protein